MKEFTSLELTFVQCTSLSESIGQGAKQLIQAIRGTEGSVCEAWYGSVQRDIDPLSDIDAAGSLLAGCVVAHRMLSRSPLEESIFQSEPPTADLSYLQGSRTLVLSQQGDPDSLEALDALAHGQLALGRLLYDWLHPMFGSIDERGENISQACVRQAKIPTIFWSNFVGPAYVHRLGRKLFGRNRFAAIM